jgi:MoaA/NifB/PqqE/SkfB family radical SAM enzyme
VINFASDCIKNGVKAVSLGGGEPFEYDGVFEVIEALYPLCYLSVTSNGLPLEDEGVCRSYRIASRIRYISLSINLIMKKKCRG